MCTVWIHACNYRDDLERSATQDSTMTVYECFWRWWFSKHVECHHFRADCNLNGQRTHSVWKVFFGLYESEVYTVHGCVEKIAFWAKVKIFPARNRHHFPVCFSHGFNPGASWLLTSCNGCGTPKKTVWAKLDGYLMVWESVFMRYSFLFYRRLAGTESHLHGNLFCRIEDLIKEWMSILLVFVLRILRFRDGVPNCFWKNSKEVNSRWGGKKRCKTRQSAIQGSESKIKANLPPAMLQHLCSVQICVGTHKHWGVKTRSLTTPFDFGSWPAS